jgi:hypothetical protein
LKAAADTPPAFRQFSLTPCCFRKEAAARAIAAALSQEDTIARCSPLLLMHYANFHFFFDFASRHFSH